MSTSHITMEQAISMGVSKDLTMLSKEVHDTKENLEWRCNKCHGEFKMPYRKVALNKYGCPLCSPCGRNNSEHVRLEMDKIAITKGGRCIGIKVMPDYAKFATLTCKYLHQFDMKPENVRSGKWCPYCFGGGQEELARYIFETLTGLRFPKARPKFLRLDFKKALELDGYNEEHKIAFEINDRYHYDENTGINNLYYRKRNIDVKVADQAKVDTCAKEGIKLLVFNVTYVKVEDYPDMIRDALIHNNIPINDAHIDVLQIELPSEKLDALRSLAKICNYTMVERIYLGNNYRYNFVHNSNKTMCRMMMYELKRMASTIDTDKVKMLDEVMSKNK